MADDRIEEEEPAEPGVGGGGDPSETVLLAKRTVEDLLERLEIRARVQVRDTAELIACRLDPVGDGGRLFEGPEGRQALLAFEYLANRIVNRNREERKRLVVAVGEEVEEGDRAVAAMAERLADSARRMNRPLTLVGMDARHRRIVHLALAEAEGVKARSVGEGALRRIVIEPEPARSEE